MAHSQFRPSPGELSKDNASADRRRIRLEALDAIEKRFAAGAITREEYDAMRSVHL